MEADRKYSYEEEAMDIRINHGSVYTIFIKKLNMRRIAVSWVSLALNKVQKQAIMYVAKRFLERYQNES